MPRNVFFMSYISSLDTNIIKLTQTLYFANFRPCGLYQAKISMTQYNLHDIHLSLTKASALIMIQIIRSNSSAFFVSEFPSWLLKPLIHTHQDPTLNRQGIGKSMPRKVCFVSQISSLELPNVRVRFACRVKSTVPGISTGFGDRTSLYILKPSSWPWNNKMHFMIYFMSLIKRWEARWPFVCPSVFVHKQLTQN